MVSTIKLFTKENKLFAIYNIIWYNTIKLYAFEVNLLKKVCCFAGHSELVNKDIIYEKVLEQIERLIIEENVSEFRVGHYGEFDNLCAKAVRSLKGKYPHIHLDLLIPYVTASIRDLKEYYNENYDSITIAEVPQNTPKRFYISKCNEYMINTSDFLICYVKNSFGGARQTLTYAKRKKNIKIFNLTE